MMWGDGFEIETVINCRFAAAGVSITEVPSVEKLRMFGESNLHAVSDGIRVLKTLITEWRLARATRRLERSLDLRHRAGAAHACRRGLGPCPRRRLTTYPRGAHEPPPPTATPAEPLRSGRSPDPGGADRHGDRRDSAGVVSSSRLSGWSSPSSTPRSSASSGCSSRSR